MASDREQFEAYQQAWGTGSGGFGRDSGGLQFRDYSEPPRVVRLTTTGSNPYSGVPQYLDGSTWTDLDASVAPSLDDVYELGGSTTIPIDTRVVVHRNPAGEGWIFVAGGTTLLTGNVSAEASGSTATIATTKWEAVKPLRSRGPAGGRTIALIPPYEPDAGYENLDVVTKVCRIQKRYRFFFLTGDDPPVEVPVFHAEVMPDDEGYDSAMPVQHDNSVDFTPLATIPGSAGDKHCVNGPTGCCEPTYYTTSCLCGEVYTDFKVPLKPLYVHFKNKTGTGVDGIATTYAMDRMDAFVPPYYSWVKEIYFPFYTYIQFNTGGGCLEVHFSRFWGTCAIEGATRTFTPTAPWVALSEGNDAAFWQPGNTPCSYGGNMFGVADVNNFEVQVGTLEFTNCNTSFSGIPNSGSFEVWISTYPTPLP